MSIPEQLKGRQYDEIIPKLENVTVKVVFPRKEGGSRYGDGKWTLQNGYLTDGETEVRVVFSNCPDAEQLKGKTITISSVSTKYGFQGVKLAKNEYNGNTVPEIRVTKVAHIQEVTE